MGETNEPPPSDDERPRWRQVLDVIRGFELVLVLPLVLLARWLPSKRGGTMDAAPYVIEDPTYIQSVLVNAALLDILLLAAGLLIFIGAKGVEAWSARD